MTDVTVIVPWRDVGCQYRQRNLAALRDWLDVLRWPIRLVDNPGEFNRSQARNVGVMEAETAEIVVIHDADMRVDLEQLRDAVRLVSIDGGLRHPYRVCRYLDEGNTQQLLTGRAYGITHMRAIPDAPGGCSVIRRNDYIAIGGYDEAYTGWGYEDLDFAARAHKAIGETWGDGDAFHLWHPEDARDHRTAVNRERYNRRHGD